MASITRSRQEWSAIVRFFRQEEAILTDSYGEPGNKKKTWASHFKALQPKEFKVYERARKAIEGTLLHK